MSWWAAGGLILASYLLGSISFAWLIVKARGGVDLRTVGSGNLGATNAGRVLGRKWAVVIYGLDFLKGFLPAITGLRLLGNPMLGPMPLALAMGTAAFAGHCWPVWLGFEGGKGVATASGVVAAISLAAFAIAAGAFAVGILLSRRVSVGSILAALSLPAAWLLLHGRAARQDEKLPYLVFFSVLAAAVVVLHRKNIRRLLHGTEPRIGSPRT